MTFLQSVPSSVGACWCPREYLCGPEAFLIPLGVLSHRPKGRAVYIVAWTVGELY